MAEAPIADEQDRRYKDLFSHPGFSILERVNASFVSHEFARREADVIWKLSFRDRPVYLFLLIEFQSSVDGARSTGELIRAEIPETLDELMAILSDEAPEQFTVFGRGIDVVVIAEVTGLSAQEIDAL